MPLQAGRALIWTNPLLLAMAVRIVVDPIHPWLFGHPYSTRSFLCGRIGGARLNYSSVVADT
jgi:hypothetical protein